MHRAWPVALLGIVLAGSASRAEGQSSKGAVKSNSQKPARTLQDLVGRKSPPVEKAWTEPRWPWPAIDEQRLAAHGLRRIAGARLVLYTDLPSVPEIDELPRVFELAVPQWCAYLGIDPATVGNWRMVGYLMRDKSRFEAAGAIRADVPKFLNGYQFQNEFWLYDQPSSYYRRHLMLHEGTHGFMNWRLGGCGPPWYMEGMAEYLATHRWQDGRLELAYLPRTKEEVAEWGRIKIVRDDFRASRGLTLDQILRYDEVAHLRVEPYGWCWAACNFFENHPRWQAPFRELRAGVADRSIGFSQSFVEQLNEDRAATEREWHLYVAQLDYGFDVRRNAIERREAREFPREGAKLMVLADRGWQSTGLLLEADSHYQLTATGRCRLGESSKVWWSEANGLTFRFHQGLPLGMLLAAVVDESRGSAERLLAPQPIGLSQRLAVKSSGTLYLRVNDSPAELADNGGQYEVTIQSAGPP